MPKIRSTEEMERIGAAFRGVPLLANTSRVRTERLRQCHHVAGRLLPFVRNLGITLGEFCHRSG